ECSFSIPGRGTFFGTEGANPAVGEAGRRETVPERRVEGVCPGGRIAAAPAAIRAAPPYAGPAGDVYPLPPPAPRPGAGRVGRLAEPRSLEEFAEYVAEVLPARGLQVAGPVGREVARVAIVCGAGDDFLADASRAGADALLTGEARFHRALEAEALGL